MAKTQGSKANETREKLKLAALKLFARFGIDGVALRDIAEASGQKNHASIGYYFGSKEALVKEILYDGASALDKLRNEYLDKIEAEGGPKGIREVVDIILYSSLSQHGQGLENYYSRFFLATSLSHRELFIGTIGDWNRGYLRCLDHLRALMPPMPLAMKNQRFVFFGASMAGVLAAREVALADASRPHPTWSSDDTMAHLAHAMTAFLEAPASPAEDHSKEMLQFFSQVAAPAAAPIPETARRRRTSSGARTVASAKG